MPHSLCDICSHVKAYKQMKHTLCHSSFWHTPSLFVVCRATASYNHRKQTHALTFRWPLCVIWGFLYIHCRFVDSLYSVGVHSNTCVPIWEPWRCCCWYYVLNGITSVNERWITVVCREWDVRECGCGYLHTCAWSVRLCAYGMVPALCPFCGAEEMTGYRKNRRPTYTCKRI